MRQFRRNTLWLSAATLATATVSWGAYELFAMPAVEPHVGDGQFENHSWRFPHRDYGVPVAGYTIDFEQFDLGRPFAATYQVERLPLAGQRVGVYLSVVDPERKFHRLEARKQLGAEVEITIVDGDGTMVRTMKQPLGKLIWANSEGGADTHGLYDLVDSFFPAADGGRYEIRLRYQPDPALEGMTGFVHVRCGGSI
jgi:hypothetical protein